MASVHPPKSGLVRFRAVVAYDGTAFGGFQVQPGERTVQDELEKAVHTITREPARIHPSGRTDTGVHAVGQVIHFDIPPKLEPRRLLFALNAVLPDDVKVQRLVRARPDFHARFSATGKEYRYFIWNGAAVPPHLRLYRMHESRPLDLAAMRAAAASLRGRHDFASFSANPRRDVHGTERDLSRLDVNRRAGEVVIRAAADGFLYKMVRSLAGFLWQVGLGAESPAAVPALLAAAARNQRVPTAPARGLFLWKVHY